MVKALSMKQMMDLHKLGFKHGNTCFCWNANKYIYNEYFERCYWTGHYLCDRSMSRPISFKTMAAIPTLTYQEIIERLPKEIHDTADMCRYGLETKWDDDVHVIRYATISDDPELLSVRIEFRAKDMLRAAYHALVWLIKNGYIETKNKIKK